MSNDKPITEIIERRFSCRTYLDVPIERETRQQLEEFLSSIGSGPFGTPSRFKLVAATEDDRSVLRGLGTYGIIKGATGFIVGAVDEAERNLEDFGYRMEEIVLFATRLGLGTCWLGGIFTRSNFATKIALREGELMPAVVSVGYISDQRGLVDRLIHQVANSAARAPWESLFFDGCFDVPISRETAGAYATSLEMVRLGPSANNRQPWRIVREGDAWHFYLQRTRRYREGNTRLLQMVDLQRIDMGIAMSHFELAAQEMGLAGHWIVDEPEMDTPGGIMEYTASWIQDRGSEG